MKNTNPPAVGPEEGGSHVVPRRRRAFPGVRGEGSRQAGQQRVAGSGAARRRVAELAQRRVGVEGPVVKALRDGNSVVNHNLSTIALSTTTCQLQRCQLQPVNYSVVNYNLWQAMK